MKKKIIIFDMDGVLIDSIPFAKESFMFSHLGVTEEMYREIYSGNFHEEIKKYSHLKKEKTAEEENTRVEQYAKIKSKTPMFGGVRELLEKLYKQGYVLVLNTNAYNCNTLPVLENLGITNLFNLVTTAELSKSKIEKFKLIEDKYKVEKEGILFITDSLGDVREADIAGIYTVAVTWGAHDKSFFEREQHPNLVGVVDTVKELDDFITKN